MRIPSFIQETLAQAKQRPVWGLAFGATLLLPFMLIYARAGIEICCMLIGLSFLYQSWRAKEWGWLRAPFTLVCLAAWAWLVLVVTPLALNPKAGWTEALVWFRLPLMFTALRYWVLTSPAARTTLGVILGMMLALIALDCFWQFATGVSLSGHGERMYNRLTGPFDGPKVGAYLAQFLPPVVAFCLSAALLAKGKRGMVLSLVLLAALQVVIVMSGERSAFLTILLAFATVMGLLMLAEKRLRVLGLVAGIAVVGMIALLYATSSAVQMRGAQMLDTMQHYSQSDYGQLVAAGIAVGEAHPAHGAGIHGFRDLCPELNYKGATFKGLHPHNFFIEWFAEAGLPGLLLLIAMIGALLREAVLHLRRASAMERLLPAVAIGVLVQHFFPLVGMQSFFTNWGALLQWYTLSLAFAALPDARQWRA